ncbi:unnamed protein product [Mytilus coruscus]|uniref:Uncharacterized protein n=1 Tax=Mytilus coruscus TaxID=42192 RepID=A0A6J8B2C4_MYTCO|nr:unnamed protein product [Mytilus coruscus]
MLTVKKDRVANVEDMNNDYICFTCTQMDQTMSNSQENNRAETTVNHTAAKNRAACTGETATIVSEEDTILKIPIKQKPKKPNKTKDVSSQERQLEGQLVQCKARIAMLEDVNRDYKNTINLLRSQLEIKNTTLTNNEQEQCLCRKNNMQIRNLTLRKKLEGMLEKFKYELEIRDIKIGHQMEMMELKNKVSLLEMQQTITDRLEKKINKDDTNDQSPSIRDCINNEQNKASACQKNQQIEHHCESLGTQRTSNERDILKNNSEPTSYIQNRTCIEDQEAVRRAQGAQMYMNAPTRYHGAPPLIRTEQNHVNNINGKDVLENYYKKYPSQREINENLQTQRSAGNGSNGQNTEIRLPKPSMPNMRPSKENKNHFLEIGPGNRKKRRKSL